MDRDTQRIIDEVARRRTATKEFSEEVTAFAKWCIHQMQVDKRSVTPSRLKDYMALYGPMEPWFDGMDGFVMDCYVELGTIKDAKEFLRQEGYETEEKVETEKPVQAVSYSLG